MNTTQEGPVIDGLRDFNRTALALDEEIQDWERVFQTALLVCVILIGVLLSIVISGGTVGWAKGWFNQDENEDDDGEEVGENDDTISSSSHVTVEIQEEDEDVVELASISDVSVHSEPRSLPRPEEEDYRIDSENGDDENDEGDRSYWGNCYQS